MVKQLVSPSRLFEKCGIAGNEKSFAVLKDPLFFTGSAFLKSRERIGRLV